MIIKKLIQLIKNLFSKKAITKPETTKPETTKPETTKPVTNTTVNQINNRQKVADLAISLTKDNIPYVYGGNALTGMDCSGLVEYVFNHILNAGYPHQTVLLEAEGQYQTVSRANTGDLLFWGDKGSSYHVAIYIGNNQFVHSPDVGQTVSIETINSYFEPTFSVKPYIYND